MAHIKVVGGSPSSEDEIELVTREEKEKGRQDAARKAFEKQDVAGSISAHTPAKIAASAGEKHGKAGSEYVKSMIYGGMDGIVTTFALVSAIVGAGMSPEVILSLGFANVIADAISMGIGDYLSEKAELDYVATEQKREEWELKSYEDGEREEMVEIYEKKGMSKEDATEIIGIYAAYPKLFVDLMMVQELGLSPPDPDVDPRINGVVSFFAFLFFGAIPLWFYVGFTGHGYTTDVMFGVSCAGTAFAMFCLGAIKSRWTVQNWFLSGIRLLISGAATAVAAYFLGYGLEKAFNVHH